MRASLPIVSVSFASALLHLTSMASAQSRVDADFYDPSPQQGGQFGMHAICADLDLDGETELIVGAPGKNVGATVDTGEVIIFESVGFASPPFPTILTDPWLESKGQFGHRLAIGDFDGDGYPDLAVTAIGARIDTAAPLGFEQGKVIVFRGPWTVNSMSHQFSYTGYYLVTEPSGRRNIPPTIPEGDRFGERLAVGDFDQDGYDDLAVGAPYSWVPKPAPLTGYYGIAGEAYVYWGGSSASALSTSTYIEHPDTNGDGIGPEIDCLWGHDLEAGNYQDWSGGPTGCDDLVIAGYNQEHYPSGGGGVLNAGEAFVFIDFPVTNSFTVARSVSLISQTGYLSQEDFGWEIADGDYDGDGFLDLAMCGAGIQLASRQGQANFFFGGAALGMSNSANFYAISGTSAPSGGGASLTAIDRFGAGMAFLDQDGNGVQNEVVIASPWFDAAPAAPMGKRGEGRAWMISSFTGSAPSEPSTFAVINPTNPLQQTTEFKWGAGCVERANIDNDAYDDVVIGNAGGIHSGLAFAGEVHVTIW